MEVRSSEGLGGAVPEGTTGTNNERFRPERDGQERPALAPMVASELARLGASLARPLAGGTAMANEIVVSAGL